MREPVAMLRWRPIPSAQDYLRILIRVEGVLVFPLGGGAREPVGVPTLLDLLKDFALVDTLPRDLLVAEYRDVALLEAALRARLLAPAPVEPVASPPEPDRLLDPDEAATMLGVKKSWLYRHADLPFVRQLSHRQTRYSEVGIRKFLASKRPKRLG